VDLEVPRSSRGGGTILQTSLYQLAKIKNPISAFYLDIVLFVFYIPVMRMGAIPC
jgi:hypothetical protein